MTIHSVPLEDAASFCSPLLETPAELSIVFPGGGRLSAQAGFEVADLSMITRDLIGRANAAMMPLQPFFLVLDALSAIVECVKAVKEALGPPPNPQKMVACIPNMVKKVEALLQLIPQLSIPLLIKSLLDVLIVGLQGLKNDLQAMIRQAARVANAEALAAQLNNGEFQLLASCARDSFTIELKNMNAGVAPLQRIIMLMNTLLKLADLPCITMPVGAIGDVSEDALIPLQAAIDFLAGVRDAISSPFAALEAIPAVGEPC